ncbi:MAG: phosphoribosylformylglycinamidine synthase subunit PurQ, partial [Candidatus Thorarchaeota archaeon]
RFPTVRVVESPAIMFKGLSGSQMGIWCAHGEGRIEFKEKPKTVAMQFIDNDGPTIMYPYNPNGSVDGITAVCSEDGRHLAMMPHPERCFLNWQLPWSPIKTESKFTKFTTSSLIRKVELRGII